MTRQDHIDLLSTTYRTPVKTGRLPWDGTPVTIGTVSITACVDLNAEAFAKKIIEPVEIRCSEPPDSLLWYTSVLHEFGHVATMKLEHLEVSNLCSNPAVPLRLTCEIDAWEWAVKNTIEPLSEEVISTLLGSYVKVIKPTAKDKRRLKALI